jgi:hypothetical protein
VKKLLAIAVLIAVAVFAYFKWAEERHTAGTAPKSPATAAGASTSAPAAGALPPSSVLKIDPRVGGSQSASGASTGLTSKRGVLPPAMSPLLNDFVQRKDFPALLAKATAAPNTGDALYVRAAIMEACAMQKDRPANAPPRRSRDERRASFVASLPVNHPDTAARIAAYDNANPDVCGPIRSMEYMQQEVEDLYAKARELKDPNALARELNCDIAATGDPRLNGGQRGLELNDSRAERIRQAIASRSPVAVRTGIGMLANSYRNGAFRWGADGPNIDGEAMGHVANIMACQYGADCNVDVLRACAAQDHCGASNYDDYLAFYRLSPATAQLVDSYRTQLTQMIDANDLSGLQVVTGDQPTDSMRQYNYFNCPQGK